MVGVVSGIEVEGGLINDWDDLMLSFVLLCLILIDDSWSSKIVIFQLVASRLKIMMVDLNTTQKWWSISIKSNTSPLGVIDRYNINSSEPDVSVDVS